MKIDPQDLLSVAASALQTVPEALALDRKRQEQREWDSLGHIMLLLAIEERYRVKLTLRQLENVASLREILALLEEG